MIFATCGSSHLPFARMMRALASLPADELHVQHGPASAPPCCARAYGFLPFDRVLDELEQADVVVSHAGVGSIMCALRAGHTPVIVPRLKRYLEAPDDHQAELADALGRRGTVIVAWSDEQLLEAVASVPPRAHTRALYAERLGAAVRAAVREPGSRWRRSGAGRIHVETADR